MPCRFPSKNIRPCPWQCPWSVRATDLRPFSFAAETISSGVQTPSLKLYALCPWRLQISLNVSTTLSSERRSGSLHNGFIEHERPCLRLQPIGDYDIVSHNGNPLGFTGSFLYLTGL